MKLKFLFSLFAFMVLVLIASVTAKPDIATNFGSDLPPPVLMLEDIIGPHVTIKSMDIIDPNMKVDVIQDALNEGIFIEVSNLSADKLNTLNDLMKANAGEDQIVVFLNPIIEKKVAVLINGSVAVDKMNSQRSSLALTSTKSGNNNVLNSDYKDLNISLVTGNNMANGSRGFSAFLASSKPVNNNIFNFEFTGNKYFTFGYCKDFGNLVADIWHSNVGYNPIDEGLYPQPIIGGEDGGLYPTISIMVVGGLHEKNTPLKKDILGLGAGSGTVYPTDGNAIYNVIGKKTADNYFAHISDWGFYPGEGNYCFEPTTGDEIEDGIVFLKGGFLYPGEGYNYCFEPTTGEDIPDGYARVIIGDDPTEPEVSCSGDNYLYLTPMIGGGDGGLYPDDSEITGDSNLYDEIFQNEENALFGEGGGTGCSNFASVDYGKTVYPGPFGNLSLIMGP